MDSYFVCTELIIDVVVSGCVNEFLVDLARHIFKKIFFYSGNYLEILIRFFCELKEYIVK